MKGQFFFSLGSKVSYNLDDYFVAESNELAFKHITSFPAWGSGRLAKVCLICGPEFSGKTHLANIFAQIAGAKFINAGDLEAKSSLNIRSYNALIIDDFDQKLSFETQMFHIFNECLDREKFLLLLSSTPKQTLNFHTKDFASRIMAINDFEIKHPTIELMEAIIYKNFSDRQIMISPEIVKYIINRINRSYTAIGHLIAKIDQASLTKKSKINLYLAKEVLQELGEYCK